jgi:hypothetical protein
MPQVLERGFDIPYGLTSLALQAASLISLIDVAAALLRGSPRDPDAIAAADHSLALSLDCTLQYLMEWCAWDNGRLFGVNRGYLGYQELFSVALQR